MSALVQLAGQLVQEKDVEGEEGITVTITVSTEDGDTFTKRVTGELTFYGAAFDVIKAQLIDPPDGKLREVPLVIFEDCAEPFVEVFRGVVRGDTVSWCDGECWAKCNGVEKTEDTAAVDCLKSTLIFDNWNGFQGQAHPRMVYCDELRPDWLHHVVLIFGILLLLIVNALTPIVFVFSLLITVVNAILGIIPGGPDPIDFDGNDATSTIQEWAAMKQRLILNIIGCGRVHPSPLLRAYLGNVCGKCGLAFQSSILNNPASDYHDTVLWSAPVLKGTRSTSNLFIHENRPIFTGESLLKLLKPVFSARYGVKNGVLYFEREDKVPTAGTWVDPAQLKAQDRLHGTVCYKWRTESPAAFLTIGFSEDALDLTGNEARDQYKDVVEWNVPFNAVQKGEKVEQFRLGMLRNRRDGIGGDVLDDYRWWPDFTGPIDTHGAAMMLENGMGALPKLLTWDGNLSFGLVKRWNVPGYVKPLAENFNFPYHLGEFGTTPNTGYEPDALNLSLYGRFHAYRNPKVINERGLDFSFSFDYTAAELLALDPQATVPLSQGTGKYTEITINLTERSIIAAGTV